MSGQLMLGVTRIYSRKVQYLLDDCKETRERITLAFRPGIVDLPADQIHASKNAITFTTADVAADDIFDWNWAAAPLPELTSSQRHIAPLSKTLRPTSREFGAYNFGRPAAGSIYGGSTASRQSSQDLDTSHLDSNDFSGVDLDLRLDDFDSNSVEMGRNAATPMSFERRSMSVRGKSVDAPSIRSGDITFEPGFDLGLNFDEPLDDQGLPLPMSEADRTRRETSALSTPPPQSPNIAIIAAPPAQPRVKRLKLLQADEELELPDEIFAASHDRSDILTEERYIPSDPELIRLQHIMADPSAYFLPTLNVGGEAMIYAGPQGLVPELAELFTFPSTILRRQPQDREEPTAEEERTPKRPRLESQHDEDDVEMARRASVLPSEHGFPGFEDQGQFDLSMGFGPQDDFSFDLGLETELVTPRKRPEPRPRSPSLAPSRAESIARAIQFGEEEGGHPLAMFDSRLEPESLGETPQKSSVVESRTSAGYSKNTGMAMGLLRRELEAIEQEKVVSFEKVADKVRLSRSTHQLVQETDVQASRRAASAFFFELLVLGTRDNVQLKQAKPFQDIEIRGKEGLFAEITA